MFLSLTNALNNFTLTHETTIKFVQKFEAFTSKTPIKYVGVRISKTILGI